MNTNTAEHPTFADIADKLEAQRTQSSRPPRPSSPDAPPTTSRLTRRQALGAIGIGLAGLATAVTLRGNGLDPVAAAPAAPEARRIAELDLSFDQVPERGANKNGPFTRLTIHPPTLDPKDLKKGTITTLSELKKGDPRASNPEDRKDKWVTDRVRITDPDEPITPFQIIDFAIDLYNPEAGGKVVLEPGKPIEVSIFGRESVLGQPLAKRTQMIPTNIPMASPSR